jgi:hypothetical protein
MSSSNDPGLSQSPETSNKQDKIQTIMGASSVTEINMQQMKGDQTMISLTMGKNDDSSVSVDDEQVSLPSSPIFHDITDWSHLIDSVLINDDINTNFMTTADTENNENICVSTSSGPVAPINFTIEDPTPDVTSLSNVQVSQGEVQSDSTTSKPEPVPMSIDIFANLSLVTEHSDCNCRASSNAREQDGVVNKNLQPPTEDEIVEIGKSFSQTLNIVSTDSTSESSPDMLLQKTFSTCKNNGKYKKKGTNKLFNKHKKGRLKSQFLLSDTRESEEQNRESKTKEFKGGKGFHAKELDSQTRRKGQGKFPKAGRLCNGSQRKIINEGKHKSAERAQERIYGSRNQTGKVRVSFRERQVNLKA